MLKGSMLHKRQASYSASPSHHAESSKPTRHNSHHQNGQDAFSDLRLDAQPQLQQYTQLSLARTRVPPTKPRHEHRSMVDSTLIVSTHHQDTPSAPSLTPSKVQHALRRCHSASAVRKRLQIAVEQSQFAGKSEQVDALRRHGQKNGSSTLSTSSADQHIPNEMRSQYIRRKSVEKLAVDGPNDTLAKPMGLIRSFSGTIAHSLQRECHNPATDSPSPSTSPSASLWRQPSNAAPIAGTSSASVIGGYRSSSVQMEVELAERLNEIDRSKVHGRSLLRVRACQNVLDAIVKQDELYGRLLSRIRDEYNAYVEFSASLEALNDTDGHGYCRACGRSEGFDTGNNNISNITFEYALLRQENAVIKKSCNAMQAEITRLQAELRAAYSCSNGNNDVGESDPEEGSQEDLSDVQLFVNHSPVRAISRPEGVPQLDFGALSPYNEEEEDNDEEHFPVDSN